MSVNFTYGTCITEKKTSYSQICTFQYEEKRFYQSLFLDAANLKIIADEC